VYQGGLKYSSGFHRDLLFPRTGESKVPRDQASMQVILMERIEKLGQMGEVVTVKPG